MYHMTIPASLLVLLGWLSDHADALMNASELLGGMKAARRTARLLGDLRHAQGLNTRLRREIRALRDLLALEHVDDPDAEESGYFSIIDLADPAVYEICMLREALEAQLETLPAPGAGTTGRPRQVA